MTKEGFASLQKEWELIEFSPNEDFTRQREIEKLMDATDWALHPDTGEVITNQELESLYEQGEV